MGHSRDRADEFDDPPKLQDEDVEVILGFLGGEVSDQEVRDLHGSKIRFAEASVWTAEAEMSVVDSLLRAVLSQMPKTDKKSFFERINQSYREELELASQAGKTLFEKVVGTAVPEKTREVIAKYSGPSWTEKLKKELSEESQSSRIVIVIDDVDRIEPRRIEELMSAVWSIRDLKNVLILLLYDQTRVTAAVGNVLFPQAEDREAEASHYLEKIVQFNFALPEPSAETIVAQALENIGDLGQAVFEEQPFLVGRLPERKDAAKAILRRYLTTPRARMRFEAAVKAHCHMYPTGMVDRWDFLVLQALRLFSAANYYAVVERARRDPIDRYRTPVDVNLSSAQVDSKAFVLAYFLPSIFNKAPNGSDPPEPIEAFDNVKARFGFGAGPIYRHFLSGVPAEEFIETAAQQAAAFAVPRGPAELAAPEKAVQDAISRRCRPLQGLLERREDDIESIVARATDLLPYCEHREIKRDRMTAWLRQRRRAAS
jgi:hypothetical protein